MYCNVNGCDVYYETYGEGIPLLAIHGFYADLKLMSSCFEPAILEGCISGYKRVYFDLPGMGKTKNYHHLKDIHDVINLIHGFIEKVIGKEPFIIFGQSYGCYLAREILSQRKAQVEGVFYLCPVIIPDFRPRELPTSRYVYKTENFMFEADRVFKKISPNHDNITHQVFEDSLAEGLYSTDKEFTKKIHESSYSIVDVDERVGVFENIATILTGKEDVRVGYKDCQKILKNYPRVTYGLLDLSGHNLQIDNPMLFNAYVKDFFLRLEKRSHTHFEKTS